LKDVYRELCETEPSIPIFSQAWWLDAVEGDNWDVLLAKKGGQVIGALPYVIQKKFGFTLLTQPGLTQTLGPWIKPTQKSYPKKLAYEKDVLGELADQLPKCDHYGRNWHCDQQNWLPFYWRGYEQTTKYTYRLSLVPGEGQLWKALQQNIRGDIRKARNEKELLSGRVVLRSFLHSTRWCSSGKIAHYLTAANSLSA